MGFSQVKRMILDALANGTFQHEARARIDIKNLLQTGEVSPDAIAEIIKKARGHDHSTSPHHLAPSIDVHVIRHSGWYIKFYFVDPDTMFISVHR